MTNKLTQALRIVCAIAWLALLLLAVFNPAHNYRVLFIIAAAVHFLTNVVAFMTGGIKDDREVEGPDDEQGRESESDGNDPL